MASTQPLQHQPQTNPQPPHAGPIATPTPVLITVPPIYTHVVAAQLSNLLRRKPHTTIYSLTHYPSTAITFFFTHTGTLPGRPAPTANNPIPSTPPPGSDITPHDITHHPDVFYIHAPTHAIATALSSSIPPVNAAPNVDLRLMNEAPEHMRAPPSGGLLGLQATGQSFGQQPSNPVLIMHQVLARSGTPAAVDGHTAAFTAMLDTHILIGGMKVKVKQAERQGGVARGPAKLSFVKEGVAGKSLAGLFV